MKRLPRSLIAFWAAAALSVGLVLPANAAKTFTRGVALDTAISNVGFLDFKTFMTGMAIRYQYGRERIAMPALVRRIGRQRVFHQARDKSFI